MPSSSVTSAAIGSARPPRRPTSAAVSSSGSGRRPSRATEAPSRARSSAVARPMPVPPPVTSATLFASRGVEPAMALTLPVVLVLPARAFRHPVPAEHLALLERERVRVPVEAGEDARVVGDQPVHRVVRRRGLVVPVPPHVLDAGDHVARVLVLREDKVLLMLPVEGGPRERGVLEQEHGQADHLEARYPAQRLLELGHILEGVAPDEGAMDAGE